jgi:uncharacterized protein YceH (UPF0502 family)
MELDLSPVEGRVVGALMEKERATPQNYPLTLNSTLSACNQKSNRHPVMALEETTVLRALEQLMAKGVVQRLIADDARVPKYRQTFTDKVGLMVPAAAAVVCVLLLRGPQTPGEIRGRTERLFKFETLDEVTETVLSLLEREPEPYVLQLPRQPGTKESRYAHLFSGEIDVEVAEVKEAAVLTVVAENERIDQLEAEVRALREDIESIKTAFDTFRTQFE